MKGFLASLAIAATILTQLASAAEWGNNYGEALKSARAEQKPLLVVIDKPSSPTHRMEQVNFTDDATQSELLRSYRLCHIDASTPYGKTIAKAFDATSFPYTAITDKTSTVLIFEKSGRFDTQDWVGALIKHREGNRAAEQTTANEFCFT